MDGLGWDIVHEDSFLISNTNSSMYGDKMNLQDDIFIDPSLQLQESQPSDHVLKWGDGCLEQHWCSSSPLLDTSASVSDIGKAVYDSQQVVINGGATSSLESIDCLLSATNSNTDCKNIWNFVSTSSGEFENNNNGSNNGHDTVSSKSGPSKRGYFNDSCGFKLINHENEPKPKKLRSEKAVPISSNINFQQLCSSSVSPSIDEPDPEAIAQMKEMIYRAAAFRPVNLGTEPVERPKRKNVKISTDPQTVAARQRRERISERIRVLQKLVPGGNKMDTASMLDEAANYLKFLRSQVKALENLGHPMTAFTSLPLNQSFPMQTHNFLLLNPNHIHHRP